MLDCSISFLRTPMSLDTESSRAWSSLWIFFNFTASACVCLDLGIKKNIYISSLNFHVRLSKQIDFDNVLKQDFLLLFSNGLCKKSFSLLILLFHYPLFPLQLLETVLLSAVIRKVEQFKSLQHKITRIWSSTMIHTDSVDVILI